MKPDDEKILTGKSMVMEKQSSGFLPEITRGSNPSTPGSNP